jgi:hypothetical protein
MYSVYCCSIGAKIIRNLIITQSPRPLFSSSLFFLPSFPLPIDTHNLDDLSGPVATLLDLLNEVATQTNKWEEIGLQLDLTHTDIERIKMEEQDRIEACFIKIFNKWETKATPPFTWPVIISSLESPSVAEFRLASQLKARHLIAASS